MLNSVENFESAFNRQKRNPLERTGKIFKYSFMQYARILFPLCIALIALSFIYFLFSFIPGASFLDIQDNQNKLSGLNIASIIMVSLTPALYFAVFVCAFIQIDKNIKKSYFGDEAYLRMTLPVTVGEHMAGTVLSSLLWFIITGFATCISLLFIFGQTIVTHFKEIEFDLPVGSVLRIILMGLVILFMLVSLIFIEHALSSLVSKGKIALKIGLAIVLLVIFELFVYALSRARLTSMGSYLSCLGFFAVVGIVSYAGSYLILKKAYNLE